MELEKLLFNMFKDDAFKNTESLKSKIGSLIKRVDFRELYTKIINYQVEKYGGQLRKYERKNIDYQATKLMILNKKR